MSTPRLARRERWALCGLALELGPKAPTLCGEWDVEQLVAHLLVRERDPIGAAGIAVGPLSGLTDRAMRRVTRQGFRRMVAKLHDPGFTPYAVPAVEALANTLEYLVHHEDIRRAQPAWDPRVLDRSDEDTIWDSIKMAGKMLVRPAGVPVEIVRSDRAGQRARLRAGDAPVVVTGIPSEIALLLFGRRQLRGLSYDGPPAAITKLIGADLGM